MSAENAGSGLKIFISYSRSDLAFADELYAGLELMGHDPLLDRHGIAEGEDWKARLGSLIAECETVVFVISPASAKSDICAWEVEEAARLSKRIAPVLLQSPAPHPVPPRLAALNYVRFDPEDTGRPRSFVAALKSLDKLLRDDLDWLRDMARWLIRAQEWDRGKRAANRLLSGADIAEMKAWTARRKPNAPELTPLHLDFLRESEAEEARREAEAQANLAERERLLQQAEAAAREREAAAQRAEEAARHAEAAQADRVAALAQAEAAAKETARTQKRAGRLLWGIGALILALLGGTLWQARETARRETLIYTSLAATAMKDDRYDRAMRYALQAYPPRGALPGAPFSTALEGRLAGAPLLGRLHVTLAGHEKAVLVAGYSPDGKRVVTASDDATAKIWDVAWMAVYGGTLRERVCAEKLIGAQAFTDEELADPILSQIDPKDKIARNPCLRRGPLSLDYWTRLPAQLWR